MSLAMPLVGPASFVMATYWFLYVANAEWIPVLLKVPVSALGSMAGGCLSLVLAEPILRSVLRLREKRALRRLSESGRRG